MSPAAVDQDEIGQGGRRDGFGGLFAPDLPAGFLDQVLQLGDDSLAAIGIAGFLFRGRGGGEGPATTQVKSRTTSPFSGEPLTPLIAGMALLPMGRRLQGGNRLHASYGVRLRLVRDRLSSEPLPTPEPRFAAGSGRGQPS